jgi:surface polysaccharide O-acyltransferase-like enzyme
MRNSTLDLAKGIIIIQIIIIHTVWWSGSIYIPYDIIRQISLLIDVPVLVFISGWVASPRGIGPTAQRMLKLYMHFLVMLIILIVLLTIYNNTFPKADLVFQWMTLRGFYSTPFDVVGGSMWFLPMYFSIYLFTPLLLRISERTKLARIFLFFLIFINILFSNGYFPVQSYQIYPGLTLKYFVFYLLVFYLGMYQKYLRNKRLLSLLIFCISLGILLLYAIWIGGFDLQSNKFPPNMLYFIASLPSMCTIIYLASYEDRIKLLDNHLSRFLTYSGKNIFLIYLYQGFGASAIFPIAYLLFTMKLPWYLIIVPCFMVNFSITYMMVNMVQRVYRLSKRQRTIFPVK